MSCTKAPRRTGLVRRVIRPCGRRTCASYEIFIHHNVRASSGYGVVVGGDGYAHITGNTFLMNRHAIAADGQAGDGYSAWFNLVMSNVPSYGKARREEADFDMHGSDSSRHHTGGIGGGAVEIARNTFLGTDGRLNFDLRGMACEEDRFVDNVSMQQRRAALRWYVPSDILKRLCDAELTTKDHRVKHRAYCGVQVKYPYTPPVWLTVSGNKFSVTNPTQRLGVGDFDGDGRDDLFLATGQAWYFSPAGIVEWRYLSAQTERVDAVKFGISMVTAGRTSLYGVTAISTSHGAACRVSSLSTRTTIRSRITPSATLMVMARRTFSTQTGRSGSSPPAVSVRSFLLLRSPSA